MKGQSLLEIVVLIGVVVIIGSGLVVVTLTSLKNSQFSKNQLQATKYAQGAIDAIRTIRDRNSVVCFNPTISHWEDFWAESLCNTDTNKCYFNLQYSAPGNQPLCSINDGNQQYWLKKVNSENDTESLESGNLKRLVQIISVNAAAGQEEKKVITTVSWTDVSGSHQSQLITILTNHAP